MATTVLEHGPAASRRLDRAFYSAMALTVAATVFVGFAPTFFLRSRFTSDGLPLNLQIHGVLFSAWIALFVAQIGLVAGGRTRVHRRLGWAAAVLVPAMVVAAVSAGIISMRRESANGFASEAQAFLLTPFSGAAVFAILVGAAIYFRRRSETHKRLMLLATISILDAAVARWPLDFVSATAYGQYVLTDLFIVAGMVYDLATRRRVSPVYLWGGALIVVCQALRSVVGETAAWHAVARAILQ